MSETTSKKQAVVGFKIKKYTSKKSKDSEKIEIILEADFDNLGFGDKTLGDFLGALEHHKASDKDIGLSLFMNEKDG